MSNVRLFNQMVRREEYMLRQFYSNLQTRINRLAVQGAISADQLSEIQTKLECPPQTWSEAYQIELALVEYMDDSSLEVEWQRRLAEKDLLRKNLSAYYECNKSETNIDKLRYLLGRLLSDLQWAKESRRVIRLNETSMRGKVVLMFIASFILYFMPTISRVLFDVEFTNLRVYYIYTAASAGLLGATFSQLTSIQTRVQQASLEQVRAMGKMGYIIARSLVGAGAGLIMFYLLQSGLLSGAFFPEFIQEAAQVDNYQSNLASSVVQEQANTQGISQQIETVLAVGTLARPAQGLSLLIVWCLLAGFSEKLIPGILNNKAKSVQEKPEK